MRQYRIVAVLERPAGACLSYLATEAGAQKQQVELVEYLPAQLAQRSGAEVRPRAGLETEFEHGRQAFLDVAARLGGLRHPSLMPVLESFESAGTAYLVAAHVQGPSLAELIERGESFDEPRLKSVLLPLVDALECAHDAGLSHGNLRPGNILIRPGGAPLLIGFGSAGLARFEQASSQAEVRMETSADIRALGAVANLLIRGQQAAAQRNEAGTLRPAAQAGSGRYHRSLLQAVDWALQVQPSARPPNLVLWKEALLGVREAPRTAAPASAVVAAAPPEPRTDDRAAAVPKPADAPLPQQTPAPSPTAASASGSAPAPAVAPTPRYSWLTSLAAALVLVAAGLYWLHLRSAGPPAVVPDADTEAEGVRAPSAAAPAAQEQAALEAEAQPSQGTSAAPASAATAKHKSKAAATQKRKLAGANEKKRQRPSTANKRAVAALAPELHGKWVAKSSYDAAGAGRGCRATVNRSWLFDFEAPSADGGRIDGSFKTRFSANGESEACSKPRYFSEVSGVFSARPGAKGWQILLKPVECRGDCDDTAGLFDYRGLQRAFDLSISRTSDSLGYSEGPLPVSLKRKTFLFW